MSVFTQTTSDNPQNRLEVLQNYNIHSTTAEKQQEVQQNPTTTTKAAQENEKLEAQRIAQLENPQDWPSEFARTPKFRPVNKHIDTSTREAGCGTFEWYFINGLISGVDIVGHISQAWRRTIGKTMPEVFHYEIGGEW